ncbi:MAG TPA: hypothetical protein VK686_01455 [Bryobacteraceae bacterium]|nr:hypothetical protein [Bryobacteraceae bacterium]
MTITFKNVPDDVCQELKRAAKEPGRSLNAQIIHTLEAEAARLERRGKLPLKSWTVSLSRSRQ